MESTFALGGGFLLADLDAAARGFVPEESGTEQQQIAETADALVMNEILTLRRAKRAFAKAVSREGEGKQSGRPNGQFGAINEKLADMVAAIFAAESVIFRVAGLRDEGGEEYGLECTIAKVFCSEQLDQVLDQSVQIRGGYGCMDEDAVERYYRDERIRRFFEGTSECSRILIPTILFRRADAGSLDLWSAVGGAQGRMTELEVAASDQGDRGFALERSLMANLKVLFLGILGAIAPVRECQEVLLALADMVMECFALESVLLRAGQMCASSGDRKQSLLRGVVKVVAFERSARFHLAATRCNAYAGLTGYRTMLRKNLQRLSYYPVEGLLEAKELLAATAREAGCYPLD